MASPARNIVYGVIVAATIAGIMLVPSIGGISTWKYLLAAVGFVLFILSGIGKRQR